jgi:hypothetical protein
MAASIHQGGALMPAVELIPRKELVKHRCPRCQAFMKAHPDQTLFRTNGGHILTEEE